MKFRSVGKESLADAGANPTQVVVAVAVASKKKKQKQSHAATTSSKAAGAAAEPEATTKKAPSAPAVVTATATNTQSDNKTNNKKENDTGKQKKMSSSTTAKATAVSSLRIKSINIKSADVAVVDPSEMSTVATNAAVSIVQSRKQVNIKTFEHTTTATTTKQQSHQQHTAALLAAAAAATPAKKSRNQHFGKRDKTMFPADWWNIEYPTDTVPVPSRSVVEHYYLLAVQTSESDQGESASPQPDSSVTSPSTSNQSRLDEFGVGLLSFEDVLIPAVAHAEAEALRTFQSKVQRQYKKHQPADNVLVEIEGVVDVAGSTSKNNPSNSPDVGAIVQECRRTLFNSTGAAIQSARACRKLREEQWAMEQAEQGRQRELQHGQREQEYARMRQIHKNRQRQEQKKRLPHNQELWREVAYLMTGLSKLQKEQRVWKEMEQKLTQQEAEMKQREEALQEDKKLEQSNDAMVTETLPNPRLLEGEQQLEEHLAYFVESTTTSAKDIQRALQDINNFLTEADQVEQELNRKYLQHHRFRGYKGIRNPPELIKILSQSQDA